MVRSLFKADREMVEKVFAYEKFVIFEDTFDNYDYMKRTLRKFDESKYDEFYFTAKSILNDYKSTMQLMSKINHLLNVTKFKLNLSSINTFSARRSRSIIFSTRSAILSV